MPASLDPVSMATSMDPMSMVGDNINELMQTYNDCEGYDTASNSSDDNDNQKGNSQSMNMDMDFGGDGGMDISNFIGGGGEGGGSMVDSIVETIAENPELLAAL